MGLTGIEVHNNLLLYVQVKCGVFVKKNQRMRATRDMERCLSDFAALDFARASAGREIH